MALKLNEKYPGYMNAPSVDYPQGSFKNRTSPTSEDGSYFEEAWANDDQGFKQSILAAAGMAANGQVDKVGSSQYFDALKQVIKTEAPAPTQATESASGIAKIATQEKVNNGTDDSDFVTSKKLKHGFSMLLGEVGFVALPTWLSGLIIQWGRATTVSGIANVTFPIEFPTACRSVLVAPDGASSSGVEVAQPSAWTKASFTINGVINPQAGGSWSAATGMSVNWISIGT